MRHKIIKKAATANIVIQEIVVNKLSEIPIEFPPRQSTGFYGLDELLGGGITKGAKVLLAGTKGAGKSTLLLQVATELAEKEDRKILYVSGEESQSQIKLRAARLHLNSGKIWVSEEVEVEKIVQAYWKFKPGLLIIDSLQMVYSPKLRSAPATPSQMKNALLQFCELSRKEGVTVVFVGHSTKAGFIAGMQILQHLVDVVLFLRLEDDGRRFLEISKNRFGKGDGNWELSMTDRGLTDNGGDTEDYIWPFKLSIERMEELLTDHLVWRVLIKATARWLGKEMAQSQK